MPAAPDHAKNRPEESGEKATVAKKQVKILFDVRFSTSNAQERQINRAKDNEVHYRNSE